MSSKSNSSRHEALSAQRSWAIGTSQDREYWERKYIAAKRFMQVRRAIPAVLIEVAAQHPLRNGEIPNEEFRQRLLLGKQLYEQEISAGKRVEIYVPGSRHVYEGVADRISLSEAGTQFLLQQGIPNDRVHGDDLNTLYKGNKGVYNSADECFVAASYFKAKEFGWLYSVSSPVQMFRKMLHYIEFGVVPLTYTSPTQDTFHNYIGEIFEAIPYVLFVDPHMQGEDSVRASELRNLRMPKSD